MVFEIRLSSDQHYRYLEILETFGQLAYSHILASSSCFYASFDVQQEDINITPNNPRGITATQMVEIIGRQGFKELIERFIKFGVYSTSTMLPSEMIVEAPTDSRVAVRGWINRKRRLEAVGL